MPSEPVSQSSNPKDSNEDDGFTRLHITPLDPELLKIVLPASVAPQARNISYHTIETFPDRRYGFLEIPQADADKLKRKLNGTVLRGTKMRVEKARPETKVEPTGEMDGIEEKKQKKIKNHKYEEDGTKKRKRDRNVVEGVALTDRKVKRGWTDPEEQRRKKSKKDKEGESKTIEKKKRIKSKYTEKEECLLKTKVPPNALANVAPENLPRKKKKGKSREIIVHEFEKTTKFPTFLKQTVSEGQGNQASEFMEGKGWVDEEGNVVEAVKAKTVAKPVAKKSKKPVVVPAPKEESDDDSTSSSGTSSEDESDDSSSDEEDAVLAEAEDSPSDTEMHSPKLQNVTPESALKTEIARPVSSSSARSLTIQIPTPTTPSAGKVHPLEALYKKNKPVSSTTETPAQEAQPFSFFGGDADEDIEDEGLPSMPMTPFTRQDFESRTVRSAAPTPDTAHPSRVRNLWNPPGDADDIMEDDVDAAFDEGEEYGETEAAPASSEFQTWFWENRRDLNRSWMQRRKTMAKEKRHRENKARASKAV